MLNERQLSTLPSERGQDFRERMMTGDRVHGVAENGCLDGGAFDGGVVWRSRVI